MDHSQSRGGSEPWREIEVSAPADAAALPLDALEYGKEPRPRRRAAFVGVGATAVVVSLVVTVALPAYRSAQLHHRQAAYSKLLTLSAAGESSVERAVSQTRDVSQYAEPLLNSSMTSPATRNELYLQVRAAARKGRLDIDSVSAQLAAFHAGGQLKTARDATLAYLSDWSAVFAQASGDNAVAAESDADLHVVQQQARAALAAAAPDEELAAEGRGVLGSTETGADS